MLAIQASGTMVVFDEAQYFQPALVGSWQTASERGVDVLVGTPSVHQLQLLADITHEPIHLEVECSCGKGPATEVLFEDDLTYPKHLCSECHSTQKTEAINSMLADVKRSSHFKSVAYVSTVLRLGHQDWELVRTDCPARLNIILDAVSRCSSLGMKVDDPVAEASFIDLGCCSGFFADAMAHRGFRSAGVDVSKDFIAWATKLANIKAQDISYTRKTYWFT